MEFVKAFFKRVYEIAVRYPLSIAAAVFLVIGAVFMTATGQSVQIGGILEKLFGKKKIDNDVRVLPPPERKDTDGDPILPGESDELGYVQPPVSTQIKKPGIFSNPDTVVVVHPEKGEVVLPLPIGVKNKDVAEVIEVKPGVFQIKNNDKGVNTSEIRDFLK